MHAVEIFFYAGRKYDDGAMAIKFVNEELFKAPGWKYI